MTVTAEAELAERTCIVSRKVMAEEELVRFVRAPDGKAVPDLKRNLPGRGVWVSLDKARVAEAAKKGLFSRGFGAATEADADLAETVETLLRKAVLSYMSFAKKAGLAIAGFEKVEGLLKAKKARILLHAVEAASDGKRQLDRLAEPSTVVINLFRLDELDLAFGRSNVIHAAVGYGDLTEHLVRAAARLEAYVQSRQQA
jgi:uncharacterized protein